MRRQNELENTSHDLFGPTEMDDFCDLDIKLIEPGGYSHVLCFALLFSSWWRILQYLTEKKEVMNDENGEEVEINEEEVFQVDQKPLFYTRASGNYKQNPRCKRLSHTSVVVQAVHSW